MCEEKFSHNFSERDKKYNCDRVDHCCRGPCHLFTNDFSDEDYMYCTSKMMMRGPCRNFCEALPRETLWETGSIRNPTDE